MKLDLETLQLKSGAHTPNDHEMCVMEAVAMMAGEKWSDHPQCASPVIGAFLRSYNDYVGDDLRQTLKQYILPLVGSRGSNALEERRAMIAADWLVRIHTPAWLRLAGLTAQADALSSLPEITVLTQISSIKGPIAAARRAAAAAVARAAASAAASAAVRDVARAAARARLKPTVAALQATIPDLIDRMLAASE